MYLCLPFLLPFLRIWVDLHFWHCITNPLFSSFYYATPEIVAKKEAELAQRIAAATRIQEYEADQQGYLYAARAGFEPEGCIRAMNVLNQLPGTTRDTSHPAVPKRIEALRALMKKYPPQSLAAEGKSKLAASSPLTYDRSEDGVSLRINSRNGGSFQDDLERQFGQ